MSEDRMDVMENVGFDKSSDVIAERLRRETERLMKRDQERQRDLEKKREEKQQSAASDEQVEAFVDTFNERKEEIEQALRAASSASVQKCELPFHFDSVVKRIHSLKSFISSSSYFLRMYDIRKSHETLHGLQQRCLELEEGLLPKKKFSFQGRRPSARAKSASTDDGKGQPSLSSNPDPPTPRSYDADADTCGFSHKTGETLSLDESALHKKDVTLCDLEDCMVRLTGVPSTLHVANLRRTRLLCGPVATSVFIEDCVDCTFALACQQVRVHSSRHCDFYVHVASRAIIEDTKEVRFAPYAWACAYDGLDRHFEQAGLDRDKNNWDFIDDFNWLACDKASPHWRFLKEHEKNTDWM